MAHQIPTPTEQEIGDQVEVIRGGKPVKADLRAVSADTIALVASKFGGDKLTKMFEELANAECITNGGRRIPDNRTRLAIAIYLGNHLLGMPIQRTEAINVNLDADSAVGMEERLRHSPALRAMFRQMLDKVEDSPVEHG